MKKLLLPLALIFLISGMGCATIIPLPKDKKPIVVEKMCYAEDVIEYETEEENNSVLSEEELGEKCEDCATILVRGKSVISAKPDSAIIYAVIENANSDMKASKDANYEMFDGVVSSLKNIGAAEEEICLQYFSCCPNYDYSNGRTLQGYMTSTSFSVKVDNIDNIKNYIDTMTENGATSICNIQYQLSSIDEQYSSALSSAYENAKEKATKLLGNDKLKLVKIREEMVFSSNSIARSYVEGVSTGLMGKIEIEARVLAEFETE